jgi:hypothetical protein
LKGSYVHETDVGVGRRDASGSSASDGD